MKRIPARLCVFPSGSRSNDTVRGWRDRCRCALVTIMKTGGNPVVEIEKKKRDFAEKWIRFEIR